jgi:exopolyphosphatase/guanosine-5'-triphosphate,3'-diphosphate pyrophosphatase
MKVAALDIGTNTALMLVAERGQNGFHVLRDEHSIARLGEGVDKTRMITDAAYERLRNILHRYREILNQLEVNKIAAIGTSAMRDARNTDEIIHRVHKEFGLKIEVISGEEESVLTYLGATFELQKTEGITTVIDIGGGSTEIAFGDADGFKLGSSVNIGAVRLREQGVHKSNRKEREGAILKLFEEKFTDIPSPSQLVAVAGTPTALAAMKLGLQKFDAEAINGLHISRTEIEVLLDFLFSHSAEELSQKYPAIHSGRADILPAGALILSEAMKFLGMDSVRVSTRGIRYGLALRELDKRP